MWVRKSDEQIARDRPRLWLSFRGPLLWFLVLFVLGIPRAIEGPRSPVQTWPQTWPEILSSSWRFAATVALAVYILQFVLRRRIGPTGSSGKVVICDTCHRVMHPSSEGKCQCGGKLDDFDNWTWIDD